MCRQLDLVKGSALLTNCSCTVVEHQYVITLLRCDVTSTAPGRVELPSL